MNAPAFRSIRDLEISGRRVFLRVDFNAPLEGGKVSDDTRIRAAIPTIEYALSQGAKVVLASHLGRPKGQRNDKYSMEPVGARLAELLGRVEVLLSEDCVGDSARKVVGDLREGQVALLENLRFHPEEEANDENFARELARLADVYVNDAFGAVHRAHASVSALPKLMPERAAGFLLAREVECLAKLQGEVERPYAAIVGGAKVSDKITVLQEILERVDVLVIGGAMANTFLAALGKPMGRSLMEADKLAVARTFMQKAEAKGAELLLPLDLIVATSVDDAQGRVVPSDGVGENEMALDIGPESVERFAGRLRSCRTVFWNGPMGMFERPAFAEGTFGVARALAECTGFTLVGGGDSVAAVQKLQLADRFSHVSTGGGASLEFLEGRKLPGLEALKGGE